MSDTDALVPVVTEPAPEPKMRLAKVVVAFSKLTGDLTEGMPTKRMVQHGPPAGAKLVGVSVDTAPPFKTTLVYEHKDFAEFESGGDPPEIPLSFLAI